MATPEHNAYLQQLAAAVAAANPGQRGDWFRLSDTGSMLGQGYGRKKSVIVVSQPEYEAGTDAVYKGADGGYVIHRITHKRPSKKSAGMQPMGANDSAVDKPPGYDYFFKGTFNGRGDGWVPEGKIVGKVARVVKDNEIEAALSKGNPLVAYRK